jgi:hypothetical protein
MDADAHGSESDRAEQLLEMVEFLTWFSRSALAFSVPLCGAAESPPDLRPPRATARLQGTQEIQDVLLLRG